MKYHLATCKRRRARAGFTLAEVLAALVLMALVIPAAIQGVRVANLSGVVGLRKAAAARMCERVLNELVITGQLQQSTQNGTVAEGNQEYRWDMRMDPWDFGSGTLRVMTVEVSYLVQGREYAVHLSTIVEPTVQ